LGAGFRFDLGASFTVFFVLLPPALADHQPVGSGSFSLNGRRIVLLSLYFDFDFELLDCLDDDTILPLLCNFLFDLVDSSLLDARVVFMN